MLSSSPPILLPLCSPAFPNASKHVLIIGPISFTHPTINFYISISNHCRNSFSAKWRHGLELSERYMLYLNSCSAAQLVVLVLNVRIMFELGGCCFAKLQPVKDTELKESADFQIVVRCVSSCFISLHVLDLLNLLRREQWCHTFGWYATCSGRPQGALGLSLQMPTNKWHTVAFVPLSKDKTRGSC